MNKKEAFPASAALVLSSILSCAPAQKPPVTEANQPVVTVPALAPNVSDASVVAEQRPAIQCALEKKIRTYKDLVASLPKDFKDDYTAVAKMGQHTANAMGHLAHELEKEPDSSPTLDSICACKPKLIHETEAAVQGVEEACDPMKVSPKYESAHREFCMAAKKIVEDMPEITDKFIKDCKEIAEFNRTFPYKPTQYEATQIERLKLDITHWRFKMDSLWTPMSVISGVEQMDKR